MPEAAERIAGLIVQDFALTPVIATEIEFYLHGEVPDEAQALESIAQYCAASALPVAKVEKERSAGQYECSLLPLSVMGAVVAAAALKVRIAEAAAALGAEADFSAKPFPAEPGSGLHIHVHLADATGHNVFFKRDDEMSEALAHCIGGLLATLPEAMIAFAPLAESYLRFAPGGNAPTTLSWGANNRTVALRLPDIGAPHRHIEHRVAGADADIVRVMAAILAGMHYGLVEQVKPPPQIYGDASLPQYKLPVLPRSLSEARIAKGGGLLAIYGLNL